jgi:serine/threonine protein kinase
MIVDSTVKEFEVEVGMIKLYRPGLSNTVVEVTKHGWLPGSIYYIDMEYCSETLESYVGRQVLGSDNELRRGDVNSLSTRPIPVPATDDTAVPSSGFDWQSVVDIIQEINKGLIYLHQNQVVHRDLKPKNGTYLAPSNPWLNFVVLFSERDKRWKLADFGISSQEPLNHIHTARLDGRRPSYRSPEILRYGTRVSNKADIFSLGCILYEITTGQKLFRNEFAIHDYARKGEPVFPNLWPKRDPGSPLFSLGVLAHIARG